jgi:ABC-2 type transport system ATP-binding protein
MIRFMPEHGSVVISSHMVEELESVVDHAVYMKKGAVVCDCNAEQLREERNLSVTELYREIYAGEEE